MKKFFQLLGLCALVCFSFIFTEKTVTVVKNQDPITIAIKENKSLYEIDPVEAIIEGNTIIPGYNGLEVNINESYAKMKRYGEYNSNMLVFNDVKPKNTINKNLNKYIIKGNKDKNMISLVFEVGPNDNIDKIIKILDNKNIKADFFLDGLWIENNSEKAYELKNSGHNLNILGYDGSYQSELYLWANNIIKTVADKKHIYCLKHEENKEDITICKNSRNRTIIPNIIIKSNPLKEVKEALTSGSVISFKINTNVENELGSVISHILTKGYKINTLDTHLSENRN